jgi:Ankyrin repeats (3 copies)
MCECGWLDQQSDDDAMFPVVGCSVVLDLAFADFSCICITNLKCTHVHAIELEDLFVKLRLREHVNDLTDAGEALLHLTCAGKGDQQVLELILKQENLYLDTVSQITGETALQYAITRGLPRMVLMLLDAGAKPPDMLQPGVEDPHSEEEETGMLARGQIGACATCRVTTHQPTKHTACGQ